MVALCSPSTQPRLRTTKNRRKIKLLFSAFGASIPSNWEGVERNSGDEAIVKGGAATTMGSQGRSKERAVARVYLPSLTQLIFSPHHHRTILDLHKTLHFIQRLRSYHQSSIHHGSPHPLRSSLGSHRSRYHLACSIISIGKAGTYLPGDCNSRYN